MAQRPTGVSTAVNGVSPRLQSQPLWFGSDTYAYQISSAPIAGTGVLALSLESAAVTQAGMRVGVSFAPIDIISLTTGTWIDQNPGLQPLGTQSIPSLTPTESLLWQRDDLSGFAFGFPSSARRIDRSLDNFAQYTLTPIAIAALPAPPPFFFSEIQLGLTSSGCFLTSVVTSIDSLPGNRDWYLIDVATGARTPWFTLPTGGLSFATAWR